MFLSLILVWILLSALAFADVESIDSNADGTIDMTELVTFSQCWLESSSVPPCMYVNAYADSIIDFRDFGFLSQAWNQTNPSLYLVGQWKLDQSSGNIAPDSSGQGHPGSLINFGTTPWTNGWIDNALLFDGTNDYIWLSEQANGMGQNFTRDFTIAAWLYPTSISGYQVVIGIESTSHFTTYGFEGFTLELYNGLPSIYIAYPDPIGDPYLDMNRDLY